MAISGRRSIDGERGSRAGRRAVVRVGMAQSIVRREDLPLRRMVRESNKAVDRAVAFALRLRRAAGISAQADVGSHFVNGAVFACRKPRGESEPSGTRARVGASRSERRQAINGCKQGWAARRPPDDIRAAAATARSRIGSEARPPAAPVGAIADRAFLANLRPPPRPRRPVGVKPPTARRKTGVFRRPMGGSCASLRPLRGDPAVPTRAGRAALGNWGIRMLSP